MNHRTLVPAAAGCFISRFVCAAALFAVAAGLVLPVVRLHAESTNSLYKQGQAAEAREDYDAALDAYQKGVAKDARDERFKLALARVRATASSVHISKGRKLAAQGDVQAALAEFLHAAQIDPSNEAAQQEINNLRQKQGEISASTEAGIPGAGQQEQPSVEAPVDLKPLSNEPLSLRMTEDTKTIYQAIGKAAGINVLFDPEFNAKRIQVDLNGVSPFDALRVVSVMSNTFWRPVTGNTIFVAQNTRAKRTEMDEQAVQTFYLANAWQQNDLNDVQTALRNVMPNAKVYGVQSQNAIVMRGTPDELLLARQLINDLDKPRGEVVVDIAVMEVSKNWERTLGLSWPSSFAAKLQTNSASTSSSSSSTTSSTTTTTPTLYNLAHLNSTNFAVTVGSATLNLLMTDNNTKILQSPRIRATDAQKASMKIGSRIPIATGSYQTGASTALVSSLVNTQFQYQDVGVNIEMTPTVHYDRDVTLKIKIEVSAHSSDVTISDVTEPIISQRVIDQTIRLREGEASILGGIQDNQEKNNWSGVPGLGSIPILKYVFGSKDHSIDNDDIVFVVVPHVVRSQQLDPSNLRAIDTGEGQSIDLRHSPVASSTTAVPPAPPAAQERRPAVGTASAQSAVAAAPELMAQMRTEQAANSTPPVPVRPTAPPPAVPSAVPPAAAPVQQPQTAAFALNVPSESLAAGASFQVPVVLNGGVDVASVAMQLHYDPAKLTLVNVVGGDYLSRDGQAAPPIHADEPTGNLTVGASRPPGVKGVNGSGVFCILTFQAKASGTGELEIMRASVANSTQQQLQVENAHASIVVK